MMQERRQISKRGMQILESFRFVIVNTLFEKLPNKPFSFGTRDFHSKNASIVYNVLKSFISCR